MAITLDGTTGITASGNITGSYILGNGSQLSGIITSVSSLSNGTSNVSVTSSGGNVTVGVGGTPNVAVFTTTGANIAGTLNTGTGNANVGNLGATTVVATTLTGTLSTAAQTNITSVGTLGALAVSGNASSGTAAADTNTTQLATTAYVIGQASATTPTTIGTNTIGTSLRYARADHTHSGVSSAVASTGISVSAATGAVTFTNTGVTSAVAGTNISVSGATGAVTIAVTGTVPTATTAATVTTAAQPNITSVGTLTSVTTSGAITVNSGAAATAIVNGATTGVGNIGSTTTTFNTVFAKATTAQYADLAENYIADQDYPVGTVIMIGGAKEIRNSNGSHSTKIIGTVSDNPAYLMNSGLTAEHVVTVALTGRVPCCVVGAIQRGDLLVASELHGIATVLNSNLYQPGCVIGKALEEYNSDVPGLIEIIVGKI